MQSETVSSRKVVEKPDAERGDRKKENINSTFSIADSPLLQESGTGQVRQIFHSSTAEHMYATSDERVQECFSLVVSEKWVSPTFLNGIKFLQSIPTTEKASAKTALSSSVPATTEASLFLHGARDRVHGG